MTFKLGLAQCCHPADGDVLGMADRWIQYANGCSVDFLVFPESLMTPYELDPAAFAQASEPLDGLFCTSMNDLAAQYGMWVAYTANERGDRLPYNTAVTVGPDGVVRAAYRKTHLFDTDFTRESDKVAAGAALPEPVDMPFGSVCVAICYDLRFPELARHAAHAGCQLLVYASAWVDGPRKVDQWKTLLRARAIENEIYVAGISRCDRGFGAEQRDYAGNSCVFDPLGDEIACAGLAEELLVVDIDDAVVRAAHAAMPVLDHCRYDLY